MSEEIITFVGGSRDGQSVGWRNGNTVEFPIFEYRGPTWRPEPLSAERVKIKTELYVRSRRDPRFFVFQP
jgi:hypothetical protein